MSLRCFHAGPPSWSNWNLDMLVLVNACSLLVLIITHNCFILLKRNWN